MIDILDRTRRVLLPVVVSELYIEDDAASIGAESNTVGANWSTDTEIDIDSSSAQSVDGSFSLKVQPNQAANLKSAFLTMTNVLNGDNITVTLQVYEAASNWLVRLDTSEGWNITDVAQGFARDIWIPVTLTATAIQNNPRLEIRSPSTGSTGSLFYVDEISIIKNN